jgi:chemotaxis protein methyltransferase CheR
MSNVRDQDCTEFLQRQLPRLRLRWAGYRKVRRTVCKRLRRRLQELRLESLEDYATLLEQDPGELHRFEGYCRIPISRFYRDRKVFDTLARVILPNLAQWAYSRNDSRVLCWSAGCASGEEPYSLRLAWAQHVEQADPETRITILATDAEPKMLERAAHACYGKGSLKDLPPGIVEQAFFSNNGNYCLHDHFKEDVRFSLQDIRFEMPARPFDLILCRNLVFTYFDEALQADLLSRLDKRFRAGGYLVIGSHERLPAQSEKFARCDETLPIFFKQK